MVKRRLTPSERTEKLSHSVASLMPEGQGMREDIQLAS